MTDCKNQQTRPQRRQTRLFAGCCGRLLRPLFTNASEGPSTDQLRGWGVPICQGQPLDSLLEFIVRGRASSHLTFATKGHHELTDAEAVAAKRLVNRRKPLGASCQPIDRWPARLARLDRPATSGVGFGSDVAPGLSLASTIKKGRQCSHAACPFFRDERRRDVYRTNSYFLRLLKPTSAAKMLP